MHSPLHQAYHGNDATPITPAVPIDPQCAPWLGLGALVDLLGSKRVATMLAVCGGSAERAWRADAAMLAQAGCTEDVVALVASVRARADITTMTRTILREHIVIITRADPRYPPLLQTIPDPPICLFVRGPLDALAAEQIAVVGTRKCTDYGLAATRLIITPLARSGLTITSGLALGIDGAAHRATLDAHGRTIAVLGTGVDDAAIYPAAHRALARDILASGGCIVSEYPPGTEGRKMHFPARNRIIAGLALATLITECPRDSGALITARFALDFGREVFVVPGPITAAESEGPHAMLKHGATPATCAEDITEALHLDQRIRPPPRAVPHLSERAARIVATLSHTPTHVDDLSEVVRMPVHELASHLTSLELDGVVRDVGGGRYVRMEAP